MNAYAENKKATFDYQILEDFEAGMVLLGQEVKAIRSGQMTLTASYVVIRNGQAQLIGAKIPPYQPKNAPPGYNPEQNRKLLLHKKELDYLVKYVGDGARLPAGRQGFSLIPLKVYDNNGRIKLAFGLAKGKKAFNKKEKIKERDTQREIQRQFK